MTNDSVTTTRKFKDIGINRNEIIVLVIGLLLMLLGAYIESLTIITNL